ncbi:MAG TPA: hypothetical protein VEJ67_18225 [Candidatus Cybelea sp.]|nr:hypothetical protein [Candidatus Cybelea sp.]
MRGFLSLVLALAIVLLVYKLYFAQLKSGTTAANPISTVDVVGVKNDLLGIAQAERIYQAEHGSYVGLEELASSGGVSLKRSGRNGYSYEVETSPDSFRVVAHCPRTTAPDCTSWVVDQTMEVRPGE